MRRVEVVFEIVYNFSLIHLNLLQTLVQTLLASAPGWGYGRLASWFRFRMVSDGVFGKHCLASRQCVLSNHLLLSSFSHRCDTWTCHCSCLGLCCFTSDLRESVVGQSGKGKESASFGTNVLLNLHIYSTLKADSVWNGSHATKKPVRVLLMKAKYLSRNICSMRVPWWC